MVRPHMFDSKGQFLLHCVQNVLMWPTCTCFRGNCNLLLTHSDEHGKDQKWNIGFQIYPPPMNNELHDLIKRIQNMMRVNLNLAVHCVVVPGFSRQVMNPLLFPVLFKIVIMMVMMLIMRETMEITMWPPWECASALEVFFLRFSQLKEAGTRTSPQLLVASEHIEKLWMRPVWLFPLTYDEEYSPRTGSGRVYDFGGGGLKQKNKSFSFFFAGQNDQKSFTFLVVFVLQRMSPGHWMKTR